MANDLGYAALANRSYKDPTTVGWAQQLQDNITAIMALTLNYREGLSISLDAADSLTVETGSIVINGKMRRNVTTSTITWASTGGNTIAETSSTGYYIWAYASGATSTFEVAINQTASNMTGNANARMIGWFWNNTANTIESLWFLDSNGKKYFETAWINFIKNTSYGFTHNLNTALFTQNMFYRSGTTTSGLVSMTLVDINIGGTVDPTVGCQMELITTSTFSVRTGDNGPCYVAVAGSQTFCTSGYVIVKANT